MIKNLDLVQKYFDLGNEFIKKKAIERKWQEHYESHHKQYENARVEEIIPETELEIISQIIQNLDGKQLIKITFEELEKKQITPNGVILINVLSKKLPCSYCDFWVDSPEYARVISAKNMPIVLFNFDWSLEVSNLYLRCLLGFNDLLDMFPTFIILSREMGYFCINTLTYLKPNPKFTDLIANPLMIKILKL